MPYNVKLIEYPNGEKQVRRYSSPLESKEASCYEDDKEELQYIKEPFSGQLCKVVEDFKANSTSSPEENANRSYNRTKQKIYEYSRCVQWEYFITLTFDPSKVDRYNYEECSKKVRKWLNNQRRNAPDLLYLIVPEHHKDGAWHFHGLLANTGSMVFLDSGKHTKDSMTIYNIGRWSYGFTTATKVRDMHSVSKYIGKYITKDLCALSKGKQRYFVSSNLPLPRVSLFLAADDADFYDLLSTLENSFGAEITHVSSPRKKDSFADVDYYELQELRY